MGRTQMGRTDGRTDGLTDGRMRRRLYDPPKFFGEHKKRARHINSVCFRFWLGYLCFVVVIFYFSSETHLLS